MTACLTKLDHAYAGGWRDNRVLARDRVLASLHRDPAFIALVGRIENDLKTMRDRSTDLSEIEVARQTRRKADQP